MAPGTLNRARFIFFMAVDTLAVKGIRALRNLFIPFIGRVTFVTGLSVFILIFRKRMMTVTAGDSISSFRRMGLVVKENLARRRLKHHAQRWMRCF